MDMITTEDVLRHIEDANVRDALASLLKDTQDILLTTEQMLEDVNEIKKQIGIKI